jgi:cyclic pyranopterin phosphate synthase
MGDELTHIDGQGRAGMVDVSHKPKMERAAFAEAQFHAAKSTLDRVMTGDLPKGEALAVARIAGIQAAKQVDRLIPLCHTLGLQHVSVDFQRKADTCICIVASAKVVDATGVEMEALAAASVAALTLWDMTKAIDDGLRIDGVVLKGKTKKMIAGQAS